MMGCLVATYTRVSGMTASFLRVGGMTCSFGLVCTNHLGLDDILWAKDGAVLNVNGDMIYITNK